MAAQQPVVNNNSKTDVSIDAEKSEVQQYETAVSDTRWYTPLEIQGRFDTLRDLSPDQMAALNKKVLRKIDWRLMPTITIMFLMK
jgi:hypothetical protein